MLKGKKRNKNFQTRVLSLVIAFMMLFSLMPSSLVSAETDVIKYEATSIYTAFEGQTESNNNHTKLQAFWHDGKDFYVALSCHKSINEENIFVEYEGNQVTTGTGIRLIQDVKTLKVGNQNISFKLDNSKEQWLIINFGEQTKAKFELYIDLMGNNNSNGHDFGGNYIIHDLEKTLYTVTFVDYNGNVLKKQTGIEYGTGAKAPLDPTREGHTFIGWDVAFDNIIENTKVTAKYSINNYIVTFVDHDDNELKKQTGIEYGTGATAPLDPTREGHTFIGWDKPFDNIVKDTIVKAKYTPINEEIKEDAKIFTVTFKGYDATVLKEEKVEYGRGATAPTTVPIISGYTFIGWDEAFEYIIKDTIVKAKYTPINEEIKEDAKIFTVTFEGYDATVLKEEKVEYGKGATAPTTVPIISGYTFVGWDEAFDNIVKDTIVKAKYTKNEENTTVVKYTVNFVDYNGTVLKTEEVESGKGASAPADPSRGGYRFNGWNVSFDKIVADTTVTAQWVKKSSSSNSNNSVVIDELEVPLAELEKVDHFAYVIGYIDGTIKPENYITREEVAMIFYRLLTDEDRTELLNDSNPFTDIDSERWSNKAISTLYKANVLKGYEDGEFKPTKPITRAEFAAISARFDELELSSETKFTDTSGHWAEKYINSSTVKGWIKGYEDNTFRPETDITRAESMALINNVLGRGVTEENIHPDAMLWIDNTTSDWYFEAVMEATNSHDYLIDESNLELWTGMKANKVWP